MNTAKRSGLGEQFVEGIFPALNQAVALGSTPSGTTATASVPTLTSGCYLLVLMAACSGGTLSVTSTPTVSGGTTATIGTGSVFEGYLVAYRITGYASTGSATNVSIVMSAAVAMSMAVYEIVGGGATPTISGAWAASTGEPGTATAAQLTLSGSSHLVFSIFCSPSQPLNNATGTPVPVIDGNSTSTPSEFCHQSFLGTAYTAPSAAYQDDNGANWETGTFAVTT